MVSLPGMRSAKVIAKAFSAVFQRMVHRACPLPSGRGPGHHVEALQGGLLGGEVSAGLDRPAVSGVHDSIALVVQTMRRISVSYRRKG